MEPLQGKRIAIICDDLSVRGGAEQVTLDIAALYPNAPIYTSIYSKELFPEVASRVRPSILQWLPAPLRRRHQYLAFLMPWVFWRCDLREYDVLISSCSRFSKCLTTRPGQVHICYCHTPVRFLYHYRTEATRRYPLPLWARSVHLILPMMLRYFSWEDQRGAASVTHWVANSEYIQGLIARYYRAEATVIHPGARIEPFLRAAKNTLHKGDYFFALSRFVPHKHMDLIVRAFIANGLPIKIGGTGPEWQRCKQMIDDANATNIELLGFVSDRDRERLWAAARAWIFPSFEDFGIVGVESLAAGTVPLYYAGGGMAEIIPEGYGVPFYSQTVEALQQAVERFLATEDSFDTSVLQARARAFSVEAFQQQMRAFVDHAIASTAPPQH
ncbi:glycosyltransferase [Candidatus Peribacteria bacterium]|nr:glycosyltransferase [Candidatus Peribacteria bacterium]